MAQAIAHCCLDQHRNATPAMSAAHGKKRAADSALDGEQRLSKRFDLLNLDPTTNGGARLYIPVPSSAEAAAAAVAAAAAAAPQTATTPHPSAHRAPKARRPRPPRPAPSDDSMLVEDTPHRVYIHDLAAELSDTDSDSEHPIFLSDIEKHLSKIPRHVLLGPPPKPSEHNQVVLYNVPASLSVPEERDSVRKAIGEARQRIRERQVSGVGEPEKLVDAAATATAVDEQELGLGLDVDADAMELD